MARGEITGRKPGVTADLIECDSSPPDEDDDDQDPEDDDPASRASAANVNTGGDDSQDQDDDDPEDDDPEDDEPTQRGEPAARVVQKKPPIRGPPRRLAPRKGAKAGPAVAAMDDADAYSVKEFCRRNRLSVQVFYKYPDLMPDSFYIGKRRLISREAAARWRAEREAASAAEAMTVTETEDA